MAEFNIVLDNRLYLKQAVLEAKTMFSRYAEFQTNIVDFNNIQIKIKTKHSFDSNLREIVLEFMNYALDRSVQIQQEKEQL